MITANSELINFQGILTNIFHSHVGMTKGSFIIRAFFKIIESKLFPPTQLVHMRISC